MEITTTTTDQTPRRQAAVNALAIVGFIGLIIIGILLAIYGIRYIPTALDRIGSASAISSIFKPSADEDPQLNVITSDAQIPFQPIATSSVATSTEDTDNDADEKPPVRSTPTAGSTRTTTTSVVTVPVAPHGLADLTVDITAVGYCSSDSPSSFRRSSDISDDRNGGVQFSVKNVGTNRSDRWDFDYRVPSSATQRDVTNQRELNPGDVIEYTLCFEKPKAGNDRTISVRVDTGRDINESNENNNSDSVTFDIDR